MSAPVIDTATLSKVADALMAGDTYEHDGYRFTLRTQQDDVSPLEHMSDADCWGKFDPAGCTDAQAPRPHGFTGRARRLHVDRSAWLWWEPYYEAGHTDEADISEQLTEVMRLMSDGFVVAIVTVDQRCGCCQTWNRKGDASCGGIDQMYRDMADELLAQAWEEAGGEVDG